MILGALDALYRRLEHDASYLIPPPGYSVQKVAFRVVLRLDGSLVGIQDARTPSGKTLRPRFLIVPGETKSSGTGLNPGFLWDNSGYMLGWEPEDESPERTARAFQSFRQRHLDLETQVGSPAFFAVCRFLRTWRPERARNYPVLSEISSGFGVFQILGETCHVHDDPDVRAWWERHADGEAPRPPRGQCLVTGEEAALAETHPMIKLRGGQSSGASLVSFNKKSTESYGRSQSLNAPVSTAVAFRYAAALNALVDGPRRSKHSITLGDTTVVFWTDRPSFTEDVFARFALGHVGEADEVGEGSTQDESLRQKLDAFLHALRRGREAYGELGDDPDATSFFLLGLSPNAARVVVRFFHRSTLGELLRNLRRHFQDIRIEAQPAAGKRRADPEFPPLWLLLAQTAREPKDIPPLLPGATLRSVILGEPYPDALYSAVLRRIRADREIDYARACVLKGWLRRNRQEEIGMALDPARRDPAYRLGRLFAAIEKTQLDAAEGSKLNTTIRDRFFGAAAATPGVVFPRLLRLHQHHLAKLEVGRKVNREKLVQEIFAGLEGFPSHLGLAEQGSFAVGYYHQTSDFYRSRTESSISETEDKEDA
jgi:CRISPR-associated protein Csd1